MRLLRMPHQDAAERVRTRVRDWLNAQGHGSRKQFAKAIHGKFGVKRSVSWVSDITRPSGKQVDVSLRVLDEVATIMGTHPGNLVRRKDDYYEEVTPSEMRLLRYYRSLPDALRVQAMSVLDYLFAFHEKALVEQAAEHARLSRKKGA